MKSVIYILLFVFSLLTIQPAVAEVMRATQTTNGVCKMKCCKNEKQDKENNCCSGKMCVPCSACLCCFTTTVEKSSIIFSRHSEGNDLMIAQNLNFLSGFLSQCFHPPKIA
ncbi:MAG TPA: hypothetical protein VNX01_05215 [Bacteroidia bacterium]|nr:hypothetical protein [Bacteroidia bacterium]